MTKQELDQALMDGRISGGTYSQLMAQIPQASQMPQVQVDESIPIGQIPAGAAPPQIDPAVMAKIASGDVTARIQQPVAPERAAYLAAKQAEQMSPAELVSATPRAITPSVVGEVKEGVQAKGETPLVPEGERKPAQDGSKAPELLTNPAAQGQQGLVVEQPTSQAPQMAAPQIGVGGGGGRVGAAYGDVAKAEKEFNALMQQQRAEDARRKESALAAEKIMQDRLANADKLNKDFENASQIDPGRYWAKADTWSKVGAVLASAFSGYAQAYTGGRNVGLDMIKGMIDTDIEAQRQNATLAQSKAQQAMNLYERYRQTFKDDQAAYDATKLSALNLVKAKFDMAQGKFKSAADMAKLDLEMKELSTKLQTKLMENGTALTRAIDITRDPNSKFDNELNKDPQILYNLIKDNKADVIRVGNKNFVTSNNENAKNLRNNSASVNQMNATLDRIADVQKSGLTDFQKREQFEALKAQLIANAKQQFQLGALDNGLLNFADNLFAGIKYTNITGDAQKAISNYKNMINNQFEVYANTIFPSGPEYVSKTGTSQAIKQAGKALE